MRNVREPITSSGNASDALQASYTAVKGNSPETWRVGAINGNTIEYTFVDSSKLSYAQIAQLKSGDTQGIPLSESKILLRFQDNKDGKDGTYTSYMYRD